MNKIRRGAHRSARELERDIKDWIEQWNQDPRPYVWVKTADQILQSLADIASDLRDRTLGRTDGQSAPLLFVG